MIDRTGTQMHVRGVFYFILILIFSSGKILVVI